MFPLASAILGLVAVVWYVTRPTKDAEVEDLLPTDVPTTSAPPSPTGESVWSAEPAAALYGPEGSSDLPFDPSVLFGAGTPALPGVDLSTGVPTDITSGLPMDLGGFLGNAARAIPVATLPKNATLDDSFGYAPTPLETDTRVLFAVDMPSTEGGSGKERAAILEGLYYGPSKNFSYEGATVVVDRIADLGVGDLVAGKYAIPPSKYASEHSYLEVVTWLPEKPESLGMTSVVNPPALVKGDKITLAAKDTVGNAVVWIAQVHEVLSDGRYDVILQKAYKVLTDVGYGKISPPLLLSQALVRIAPTMFVNPKSIP
jgi:hypothetical protein